MIPSHKSQCGKLALGTAPPDDHLIKSWFLISR
jgi:hypothetical protein